MPDRFFNDATRREFLIGLVAGCAAPSISQLASTVCAESPAKSLAATREQAANRRRRVIFNNDGDDIWAAGADTVEKFLAVRHTPLLNTHVDSIYYCTTQSFNHFT